jgi:predicted small secreted protein
MKSIKYIIGCFAALSMLVAGCTTTGAGSCLISS